MKVVGNIGWKKYVIKKLNKIIMHSRHQWFVPWKFFISDDDPPPPNHTSSQQSYYNLNQNCLLKLNWQSRKVITRTYGRLFDNFPWHLAHCQRACFTCTSIINTNQCKHGQPSDDLYIMFRSYSRILTVVRVCNLYHRGGAVVLGDRSYIFPLFPVPIRNPSGSTIVRIAFRHGA